jgi:hypothetical protein
MEGLIVIGATHVVAAASTKELAFSAFEAQGADRAEEHGIFGGIFCDRGWLRLVH